MPPSSVSSTNSTGKRSSETRPKEIKKPRKKKKKSKVTASGETEGGNPSSGPVTLKIAFPDEAWANENSKILHLLDNPNLPSSQKQDIQTANGCKRQSVSDMDSLEKAMQCAESLFTFIEGKYARQNPQPNPDFLRELVILPDTDVSPEVGALSHLCSKMGTVQRIQEEGKDTDRIFIDFPTDGTLKRLGDKYQDHFDAGGQTDNKGLPWVTDAILGATKLRCDGLLGDIAKQLKHKPDMIQKFLNQNHNIYRLGVELNYIQDCSRGTQKLFEACVQDKRPNIGEHFAMNLFAVPSQLNHILQDYCTELGIPERQARGRRYGLKRDIVSGMQSFVMEEEKKQAEQKRLKEQQAKEIAIATADKNRNALLTQLGKEEQAKKAKEPTKPIASSSTQEASEQPTQKPEEEFNINWAGRLKIDENGITSYPQGTTYQNKKMYDEALDTFSQATRPYSDDVVKKVHDEMWDIFTDKGEEEYNRVLNKMFLPAVKGSLLDASTCGGGVILNFLENSLYMRHIEQDSQHVFRKQDYAQHHNIHPDNVPDFIEVQKPNGKTEYKFQLESFQHHVMNPESWKDSTDFICPDKRGQFRRCLDLPVHIKPVQGGYAYVSPKDPENQAGVKTLHMATYALPTPSKKGQQTHLYALSTYAMTETPQQRMKRWGIESPTMTNILNPDEGKLGYIGKGHKNRGELKYDGTQKTSDKLMTALRNWTLKARQN